MQSTKEETFLSSNRLETAPTTWHGSYSSASSKTLMLSSSLTTAIEEEPFHSNMKSAEAELTWGVVANKLSVVFLVAMGTICFLTNTLVLLLLCRQRGALCFRYRLVRSQAVAGIITSTVVIYPLKVISLVLLDPSHSRSVIPSSESFFTSRTPCYLLSSLPMVFCGLLGLIHALFLHWEQTLYVFSPQKYLVLISSPRAVAAAILLIWLIPALTSGLPLIASSAFAKWRGFCYAPAIWSPLYSFIVLFLYATATFMWTISFAVKLRSLRKNRRRSDHRAPILYAAASGDFLDHNDGGENINRSKSQTAVVVTRACHHVTSTNSTPWQQELTNVRAFLLPLLCTLPAVFYSWGFIGHAAGGATAEEIALQAESDCVLPWLWLLIVAQGSLVPIHHILSDDVISSLSLDFAHSLSICSAWLEDKRDLEAAERRRRRKRILIEDDNSVKYSSNEPKAI